MKMPEIIVLNYIKNFRRINFEVLSAELNMPPTMVAQIINRLYLTQLIKYENNQFIISENLESPLLKNNEWYTTEEKLVIDKPEFEWNYLYVPENFDII